MLVKRTFTTTLEPVDAFGLTNELLRPRGFTLDKGNHARAQKWRRGNDPAKKTKDVIKSSQEIEVEFDRGRVNVTATCAVSGRSMTQAQRLMTAYAEAVEKLMSVGASPKDAAKGPRRAESAIRAARTRRSLSLCMIVLGILGGGAYVATHPKDFPLPTKLFSGSDSTKQAQDSKKSGKSAPVITVRRAGVQSSAAPSTDR